MERDWRQIRRAAVEVVGLSIVCLIIGSAAIWFLLWLVGQALPDGTH